MPQEALQVEIAVSATDSPRVLLLNIYIFLLCVIGLTTLPILPISVFNKLTAKKNTIG